MRFFRKIRLGYKKILRKCSKFLEYTEKFATDVLYDRKKTIGTTVAAALLLPLSFVFLQIVKIRKWLYDKRIFAADILGCPVIVVGNLTLGGTGKTPVVEKIARALNERGRKVAILSRGYKSKSEPAWKMIANRLIHRKPRLPKVVSNGKSVLLSSELAGDEPFMLAKNLPGVVVLVHKDRILSGQYAIQKFGTDVLILDDGYQYFPLRGHVSILLIDKTNPFGSGHLIPRGILRESISQIKRASYVLLTKADLNTDDSIIDVIRRYNSKAKIIQCSHFPRYLETLDNQEFIGIDHIRGKKIMVFSGIASPESFENFLSRNGAEIVYKKRFVDHHRFSKNELENIFDVAQAKGVEFAITTEKDAVRIHKDFVPVLPVYFLKIDIEIQSGESFFEEAISKFAAAT